LNKSIIPPPSFDPWTVDDRLVQTNSLTVVRERIAGLADAGNLAAVIIHLNDTYLIEERPPRIPGLAKIAGTIGEIRALVRQKLGSDRTLVCHGGDYLGPSRLSKELQGAQMVDLLRHCGLTVATIGNHEFDHEFDYGWATLRSRLIESQREHTIGAGTPFKTVLTNLKPALADDRNLFQRLLMWPEPPATPILAVLGYSGEQTARVACSHGFAQVSVDHMIKDLSKALQSAPSVLGIIVLTHASRDEDCQFQRLMQEHFPLHAIYVLGGHDHHVHWAELLDQSILMKCLSNCKSLGIIAVPNDALAAIRINLPIVGRDYPVYNDPAAIRAAISGDAPVVGRSAQNWSDEVLNRTIARLRTEVATRFTGQLSADLLSAFELRIARTLVDAKAFLRNSLVSDVSFDLVSMALSYARRSLHATVTTLQCSEGIEALPVDSEAQAATAHWINKAGGAKDDDVTLVVDFSAHTCTLDALDDSIRVQSTDFGNFVTDAILHATRARVALVNAGSLRADDRLPAKLTVRQLRDALLYDGSDAGIVLSLSGHELSRAIDHAKKKGNHGAFLQVSAEFDAAIEQAGEGLIRVALVRHMIASASDEDGYCAALAEEGESPERASQRLLSRVHATDVGSLEDWIRAGARHVAYSTEHRLTSHAWLAQTHSGPQQVIRLIDDYRGVCGQAGLKPWDMLAISTDPEVPIEVRRAVDHLVGLVEDGWLLGAPTKDIWFTLTYKSLEATELNHTGRLLEGERHPIYYASYLDKVAEVLGLRWGRISIFKFLELKGKTTFTPAEAERIRDLLRQLRRADRDQQMRLRHRLRHEFGFYISNFKRSNAEFSEANFNELAKRGIITIR
jgi:2',3'-cyclic-nucleotide 2'-phosphodiesterase (5'-nucleotidase family)